MENSGAVMLWAVTSGLAAAALVLACIALLLLIIKVAVDLAAGRRWF